MNPHFIELYYGHIHVHCMCAWECVCVPVYTHNFIKITLSWSHHEVKPQEVCGVSLESTEITSTCTVCTCVHVCMCIGYVYKHMLVISCIKSVAGMFGIIGYLDLSS